MIRVAVCLSGQPRTWKSCYPTWIELFKRWNIDPDFFCHMWDFNSSSSLLQHQNFEEQFPDILISDEEKAEFISTIKPKKIVFQAKKDDFGDFENVPNRIGSWTHSQFYSMWRATNLKRQYEIENDFEYDVVIRMRADNFIVGSTPPLPAKLAPSTIYSIHNVQVDPNTRTYRMADIFFVADSLTYDHVAKFHDALHYIDRSHIFKNVVDREIPEFPPECALYYYCASIGINNMAFPPFHIKIMRPAEHFSKTTELQPYETRETT